MPEHKQVLIVEDSEENVVFLSEILEAHGYQYRVADDGKEAMRTMRDSRPDLVLLDIMMPRKSGLVVFKEMKADPALETIPIIIITGASQVTGVDLQSGEERPKGSSGDEFARGFGAALHEQMKDLTPDGFIEKPIEPRILIEKIKKLLP
jgi:two-component system alkaline phosphatase synthesis response regulator PhoP